MMHAYKRLVLLPLVLAVLFMHSGISQETYLLNYDDVDIRKVTQDIARFSKKTIILDPRVKGKVTIFSDSLLDEQQVWQVYLRTAQVNGFSTINEGNIVRIVPENEATRDNNTSDLEGDFITKIFLLENRTAAEVLPMLKPITGRQSHLSSIPSINSIILVDRKSNVDRIQLLLNQLDMNDSAKISIIKLENLSSVEAVRILDKLKVQSNPTINNFIAIPFTQSNSVILSASKVVTKNIEKTLQTLDEDVQNDGTVAVIYLKYAKADEVAAIINTVSPRFESESDAQKPVVTFHEKTNSLIVSSEDSNLDLIRNLVAKIDIRRAQVLVEAIIVELSETAAKNLGIDTIFKDSDIPIGITRFPSSQTPDLLAITGNAIEGGDSATLGALATNSLLNTQGLVAGFGNIDKDGDSFLGILNAIEEDQNSNILSTPSIIAMDNEPANLVIGQEIPITTGESLGANNANPFRTTSRQEVGVKLSITPQINEGNSVILEIKQEVSGVAGALTAGTDVVTNKRTIETTVLVDNNQVIVLGGLIDDDVQETVNRVPVLGRIPLLGKLFSSTSKSVVRRNLTVFLRPKILADSQSINQVSMEKYNFIKAEGLLNEEREKIIDLMPEGQ
ncbi:MAG TPA: type II secretion system secretin GspD [Gammaproteobacteria bacterium]|nr:type II secretion system secretin GspD [Gammaproteobacteria bacterium]HJM70729.1 type II secretion system secretin GspD [Gammaproteobacteria bacterium]